MLTAAGATQERPNPAFAQPFGDEACLLAALRAGDESAFAALLDRHHRALVTAALAFVANEETAEEVVQETWLAVLRGIGRFEARSALGTWIFSIMRNQARRRGQQEARSVPFSRLVERETRSDEPAVAPDRFLPAGGQWAGHWVSSPRSWDEAPEERFLAVEIQDRVRTAIAALPPVQRTVITLRDVQCLTAEEVCDALQISQGNQRVLLHRARSRVRQALAHYLADDAS